MRFLFAAAVPLTLAGCSQPDAPPVVTSLTKSADPSLARPAPPGPGVAYSKRSIEEPGDWRRLNDEQGASS